MAMNSGKLTVFYDGACPVCVRDRRWYEKLEGHTEDSVQWLDITGRDDELRQLGIDPYHALRELHDGTGAYSQTSGLAHCFTRYSADPCMALPPLGGTPPRQAK